MTNKYNFLPKTFDELISLSKRKLIYSVKDKPDLFVKIIELNNDINTQISVLNEIKFQKIASKYNISPKILDYYEKENVMYIIMEKVIGKPIYDIYGEIAEDVPDEIFAKIHDKLTQLLFLGIEYSDISPYNFMIEKDTENIKIIDFGHAKEVKLNWFLKDFVNGEYGWNPDFL
jgi:serine/threonine protein kinase